MNMRRAAQSAGLMLSASVESLGPICKRLTLSPSSFRAADAIALQHELDACASRPTTAAVMHASGITGSDSRWLCRATPVERAKHFQSISNLLRTMGSGDLPTVAVMDGVVTGPTLGVGVHAIACVVTERTSMSLPGPAHGFVPESFATYQLARLQPAGLGAYLTLTGAALTGAEMMELGLATHATESQAIRHIERELSQQTTRHVGRTLRNVELACIEPRQESYTEAHALCADGGQTFPLATPDCGLTSPLALLPPDGGRIRRSPILALLPPFHTSQSL